MIPIFKLLGMVLDELTVQIKFEIRREGAFCIIGCNDPDTIIELFLPLFDDEITIPLLEKSKRFNATISIDREQIVGVAIETDLGKTIAAKPHERLIKTLSEVGMDDTYLALCQQISRKC